MKSTGIRKWVPFSELGQVDKDLVRSRYKPPYAGWIYPIGRMGFVDLYTRRKRPARKVWTRDGTYGKYTMWKRPEGDKTIYNVTTTGRPPGPNAGGYYSKQSLLLLKGSPKKSK